MAILRILSVSFDTHLDPWELPRFRGAVAHFVGLQHEWYHNHNNTEGGYHHRYPLIQYRLDGRGQQLQPTLLCLQDGVEEAHHFFSQPDWSLHLPDRQLPLRIARMDMGQHDLRLTEQPLRYRLHRWKAFDSDNYAQFCTLRGLTEQFSFLENVLSAHVLRFASGVGWQIPARFDLHITDLLKRDWVQYKGVKFMTFTIEFEANLLLPNGIGLGKGVSVGFGRVQGVRTPPAAAVRQASAGGAVRACLGFSA